MEIKKEIAIETSDVTSAIETLNGRHRVTINGDGFKAIVDATATLIETGNQMVETGKAIEEEILSHMDRPLNKKTEKPTNTVHMKGNIFDLKATFKESPESLSKEAMAHLLAVAILDNCVEQVFSLRLKVVDLETIPAMTATALVGAGYTTKETKTLASPVKL